MISVLGGGEFLEMLQAAERRLAAAAARIDALNVFPVPDGDTGTNMLLTVRAALRAAARVVQADGDDPPGIAVVARAAAEGALLGARGNSGVILSQIFLGLARGMRGAQTADCLRLQQALRLGCELAYAAVQEPVEGTMLTVIREASEVEPPAGSDLPAYLEAVLVEARRAVARTRELLEVLREAGVVDAGGEGLCTLLEGMSLYASGRSPEPVGVAIEGDLEAGPVQDNVIPWGAAGEPQESYGYCVEFMVAFRGRSGEQLTRALSQLGSSLVVAGLQQPGEEGGPETGENLVRVHLHTPDPDALVRRAGALGRIEQLQIRDMSRQHALYLQRRRRRGGSRPAQVVCVVPGLGLARVCLSLGAAVVVVSNRCPSAEELLEAAESSTADRVIVLPNDRNICAVAEQAAKLAQKEMAVVATLSVPQGMAALVAFDAEQDVAANRDRMMRAASAVHSVEICRAIRSSRVNGRKVHRGQHMALLDGELVATAPSPEEAVCRALDRLPISPGQIISLYYGAGVSEEQACMLAEQLRASYSQAEVEVVAGGQPLHSYLVGVESG